jgi:3D (Asp-Asp-Asp) domain-containing protein
MNKTQKTIFAILVVLWALVYGLFTKKCLAEYVTAPSGLNVRAERNTDSAVIEVLPFGAEVTPSWTGKRWAKLENGFVSTEWLSADNPFDSMTALGTWRITAYAYTGSPCANGEYPEAGRTVACNSLPFGTEVYIDGVGFRTVTDRGPDSMGDAWIDLYLCDYAECVQWGSQYRKVWVMK